MDTVRLRLGGRIRDFRLTIREMGLVMEGHIRLHGRALESDRASPLYFLHEADVYLSPQLRIDSVARAAIQASLVPRANGPKRATSVVDCIAKFEV
jgi:hypothetical protein